MKKYYKIILMVIIALLFIISIFNIKSKNVIKTVRSERELLKLSDDYYGLNTYERLLTLPFSLLIDNYGYNRNYYKSDGVYINESVDIATTSSTKDYSKTNIQVEGVDEADIIKTDGDYIYSISDNYVVITNVKDPENTFIETKLYTDSAIPHNLLLYNNYLVVFSYSNASNYYNQNTLVEIYDVSNKSNIKRIKSFELYESYYTSRCIDGKLYVFSKGYLREENNKIERKYKDDFSIKEIELKDIKYLKNSDTSIQTLIASLDLNNIGSVDVKSYLIDISNAYVSKNNIYLLDYSYDDHISIASIFTLKGLIGFFKSIDEYDYGVKTKIYKFKINKDIGVLFDSTTTIEGSIINQYSLDEKDNHLRIALQTDDGTRVVILNEKL